MFIDRAKHNTVSQMDYFLHSISLLIPIIPIGEEENQIMAMAYKTVYTLTIHITLGFGVGMTINVEHILDTSAKGKEVVAFF